MFLYQFNLFWLSNITDNREKDVLPSLILLISCLIFRGCHNVVLPQTQNALVGLLGVTSRALFLSFVEYHPTFVLRYFNSYKLINQETKHSCKFVRYNIVKNWSIKRAISASISTTVPLPPSMPQFTGAESPLHRSTHTWGLRSWVCPLLRYNRYIVRSPFTWETLLLL